MSYRAFIRFPKTFIKRFIFVLSWFCWVVGIALMIYQLHELILWSFNFPTNSGLRMASWCLLFSIQIFSMWMPFAILLIYWEKRNQILHIVYISGCAVTIILALAATILIEGYENEGEVKQNYLDETAKYINEHSELPGWISASVTIEGKCCGWFSPTDIGLVFPLTEKLRRNKKFMQNVADCYGNFFKVNQSKSDHLSFEFVVDAQGIVPEYSYGCGEKYKMKAREMCYFTAITSIVIAVFAVVFICAYLLYVRKLKQYEPLQETTDEMKPEEEMVETTAGGSATSVQSGGLRSIASDADSALRFDGDSDEGVGYTYQGQPMKEPKGLY